MTETLRISTLQEFTRAFNEASGGTLALETLAALPPCEVIEKVEKYNAGFRASHETLAHPPSTVAMGTITPETVLEAVAVYHEAQETGTLPPNAIATIADMYPPAHTLGDVRDHLMAVTDRKLDIPELMQMTEEQMREAAAQHLGPGGEHQLFAMQTELFEIMTRDYHLTDPNRIFDTGARTHTGTMSLEALYNQPLPSHHTGSMNNMVTNLHTLHANHAAGAPGTAREVNPEQSALDTPYNQAVHDCVQQLGAATAGGAHGCEEAPPAPASSRPSPAR